MEVINLEYHCNGTAQAGNDTAGTGVPASWPLAGVMPTIHELHTEP